MKIIPLHPLERGRFACVDEEDYDYLIQFKWQHLRSMTFEFGGYAYANLKFTNGDRFTAGMHRIIMGDKEPYEGWAKENGVYRYYMPDGNLLLRGGVATAGNKRITVDHIDGDGLNNTRDNLRHATASEQMKNRCKCRGIRGSYFEGCNCRTTLKEKLRL